MEVDLSRAEVIIIFFGAGFWHINNYLDTAWVTILGKKTIILP